MLKSETSSSNKKPLFQVFADHFQNNCHQFIANIQHLAQHIQPPTLQNKHAIKLKPQLASISAASRPSPEEFYLGKAPAPVTKEEIGKATWTFLHSLAAQYPEKPTMQQQKDVKNLVDILTRMYPCKECADHFKTVVKNNPPKVKNHQEFEQWMCQIHNVVNRSLGKPIFNCNVVGSRWGELDCDENACSLEVGRYK